MMRYAHIAARAFNRPLLLAPKEGLAFLGALGARLSVGEADAEARRVLAMDDEPRASLETGGQGGSSKPYTMVGKVAVIAIEGTLVNRFGYLHPACGMTGYDGIRALLMRALADDDVKAIAFDIDSPGGEVAGCFDLADYIHAAAQIKPCWAIVDGMACSAAYALASGCTRITASSVAFVGSIGVIVAHADYSKFLEASGVKISLIFAGAHKADGNPYEVLPAAVRADIQAEIDAVRVQFTDRVARFRTLSTQAVNDTQARVYLAADAMPLRLLDAVQAPMEALADLIDQAA